MNVVEAMIHREQGQKPYWDYSIALKRLKCHDYDEYRGILPSTDGPDFNPEPPVFACTFCTTPMHEHLLALANEDGKIALQNTNLRSDHSPFEGYQAHRNAIFDVAWAPGEMKLVSASGDHTTVLWDVQKSGLQEVARFHAHTRSVKTVTFNQEEKMIFASGARDGMIMLWDTRTQKNQQSFRPDNFISNSHSAPGTPGSSSGSRNRRNKPAPSRASSITGLAFQDSHTLMSCGAGDGKVNVWDIRKSYSNYRREPQPKFSMSTPNGSGRSGFTCLALDPGGFKLYASCMDNTIYCYNVATYEEQPVGLFKGHKNATFYVKACLSPDGRYLLSGSSDEQAYVWDTYNLEGDVHLPMLKLVGHGAEVTTVAWCPVGEVKIVTCSDDARHCLWRVGMESLENSHQVNHHGWAEEITDRPLKVVPSTPASPATPSFTSWRRWTPCIQRTPDADIGPADSSCEMCHQLSTPCMRCVAMRTPVPVLASQGSKKRLEVLWEEDSNCPECERERRNVLNQVTNSAEAPARRLFSPTKRQAQTQLETSPALASEGISAKKRLTTQPSLVKRSGPSDSLFSESCIPSPKKSCSSNDGLPLRRTSPRKRCPISETGGLDKKFKPDESINSSRDLNRTASCGSHINGNGQSASATKKELSSVSNPKEMNSDGSSKCEGNILLGSPSKTKANTPAKRRFSERSTDSPHKRQRPNDDLMGISKIDESLPSNSESQNRPISHCARHKRMGFSSPTLNLPNYVLDGSSPHHRCSPVHQHKENVDWLTRLRRERSSSSDKKQEADGVIEQDGLSHIINSRRKANHATSGKISSKVAPAINSSSSVTPAKTSSKRATPAKSTSILETPSTVNQTGRRIHSRRSSGTDAPSSVDTSLLRFFRVSEKPARDQQCSVMHSATKASSTAVI